MALLIGVWSPQRFPIFCILPVAKLAFRRPFNVHLCCSRMVLLFRLLSACMELVAPRHGLIDRRMESTMLHHFFVSFLWQNQHSGGAGLPHCYLGVGLSSATSRNYFSATPSHKLTLHSYGLSLVTPWCTSRVRTASPLLQRRAGGASPWPYCYHSMHTGIVAMQDSLAVALMCI